ncbi:MAG: LamB/YcsF family protein [Acidobacteria bacterium]|nr:LamB/YcsF family protein [Acidobacteriota bacterium]
MRIDLNADVGEGRSATVAGSDAPPHADAALMPSITSANVACGFHAGDPGVMRATVALARAHGVAVGAHPGFPDLEGFGRRELHVAPHDVEDFVVYQVGALAAIGAAQGVRLQHVKPHGALFNMAVRDRALADAVARAAVVIDRELILFGLPGSEIVAAGARAGLRTAREGFADRAYRADGTLVPRSEPGAVIHDPEIVVERAVRMVRDGVVDAIDGSRVRLAIDTLCVHGDTPGAAELAARIRQALVAADVEVKAVGAS